MENNVVQVRQSKCFGCFTCATACPSKAIEMRPDPEGFLYPSVNRDKCKNCGLCLRICPSANPETFKKALPYSVMAAVNKNEDIRLQSSSGGIFSALADEILSTGQGVVYGVALMGNRAAHIRAQDAAGVAPMRGAKYIQSETGDIFTKVKRDLDDGLDVLFSGTPCQISGLKRFLQKDYDNLVTVDVVCHGVSSPLLFSEHIKSMEKKRGQKIVRYNFSSKVRGWRIHTECATFQDGREEYATAYSQKNAKIFFQGYSLRPSCYSCPYARIERVGDITLADFWDVNKSRPELDDDKGLSLVLINSPRGAAMAVRLGDAVAFTPVSISDSVQPHMHRPPTEPQDRAQFWQDYRRRGYRYIIRRYADYLLTARLKDFIKRMAGWA